MCDPFPIRSAGRRPAQKKLRSGCGRAKHAARGHAPLPSAEPGDLPAFHQPDDSLHGERKEAQHKQTGENEAATDQKDREGRQQAHQRGANLCCPLKHINSRSVLHVRQKTVVIGLVIPSRPRSARGAGGLRRVVGAETLGADAGKNKVAVRRIVSAVTRGTGISDRRQALPVKRRTTAGAPGTVAFNQDVPPTDFALRSSQLHDRRGSSASKLE